MLQHPSYSYFSEYVEALLRQDTSDDTGEKADKGVKPDKPFEVRIPFPCVFDFKPVLCFSDDPMTAATWAKQLRQNTNMANAHLLPWSPLEASEWAAECERTLGYAPGSSSHTTKEILKYSVPAFSLIKNKALKQALFNPKFNAEPQGFWSQNIFSAWNDIYLADKAEVTLLIVQIYRGMYCLPHAF